MVPIFWESTLLSTVLMFPHEMNKSGGLGRKGASQGEPLTQHCEALSQGQARQQLGREQEALGRVRAAAALHQLRACVCMCACVCVRARAYMCMCAYKCVCVCV